MFLSGWNRLYVGIFPSSLAVPYLFSPGSFVSPLIESPSEAPLLSLTASIVATTEVTICLPERGYLPYIAVAYRSKALGKPNSAPATWYPDAALRNKTGKEGAPLRSYGGAPMLRFLCYTRIVTNKMRNKARVPQEPLQTRRGESVTKHYIALK